MNARSQVFELEVLGRQIEEVCQSIFQTLLLYRTTGKFTFRDEQKYSIGTLGIKDTDCDFIDFTYVGLEELEPCVKTASATFSETLRISETPQSGQIVLEFYQKKRARWPFQAECIPWEVWTIKINVISLKSENERTCYRQSLALSLAEKLMYIADFMANDPFVPKMPNQSDLDLIFDTSFETVQPYLFKITHQGPSTNVSNTMRKFLKDTLML